jgi:hypothetical protein
MIQEVVSFPPEFQVLTLLGHAEVLLQSGVQTESSRTEDRVPAGVPELIDRLQDECRGIKPSFGRGMIHALAYAGRVRAVIANVCVGIPLVQDGASATGS